MSGAARKGKRFFTTRQGEAILGDSLEYMSALAPCSIDLIVTSPPFGLVRKKDYGNEDADRYVDWFYPFAEQFRRILKPQGSLVIDIGGAWKKGIPTRSLYHFRLLIMLCEKFEFHLAQEFYWWNPSKLPTPAEWVNIRRVRVKDAVNSVYWLSPTPYPKATNRRILYPYSESMRALLRDGYRAKKRPSGHDISTKFARDNGAAIPPNLIAIAHTESNSFYLRYCRDHGLKPHPARFPVELPEFFVRMLTDERDTVLDPFGGSCVTGEVCERLKRRWICVELLEEYLAGARGRFARGPVERELRDPNDDDNYYKIPRPDLLWNGLPTEPLRADGGARRPPQRNLANGTRSKRKIQTDLLPD
jgi:site-specific DNA-methyltransferase (cytosine-N4-specific)